MIDHPEGPDHVSQFPGGEEEGIAAGEEDIGDLGVLPDVRDIGGNVPHHFATFLHEEPFPEAEPAEPAALVGEEEQGGLVVLMLEAGGDGIIDFFRGIQPAPSLKFLR